MKIEYIKTQLEDPELLKALDETTPLPAGAGYEPSVPSLEYTAIFGQLQNNAYGGMPIQIGYCNGVNPRLTCLEYHRTSEIDIAGTDMVFLVARQPEIEDGVLTTDKVKAFGGIHDALRIRPVVPAQTAPKQSDAIKCEVCGKAITAAHGMDADKLAQYTAAKYGKKLCANCAAERAKAGAE